MIDIYFTGKAQVVVKGISSIADDKASADKC